MTNEKIKEIVDNNFNTIISPVSKTGIKYDDYIRGLGEVVKKSLIDVLSEISSDRDDII